MPQHREDRIRDRAYDLWEREGHRSGRDQEHWHRAEREIGEETQHAAAAQGPDATVKSPEPVRSPDHAASQAEEAVEAMQEVSGPDKER